MTEATIKISGYNITEQIYAGSRTVVYRCNREYDLAPVVIKFMRHEYPVEKIDKNRTTFIRTIMRGLEFAVRKRAGFNPHEYSLNEDDY